MKQLILRHHVAQAGAEPTVEVIYQQSPAHNGQSSGPLPFSFVFTEEDRKLLQWYLEQYLLCPLAVYQQRAEEAEAAMARIGEGLFRASLGQEGAFPLYSRVRDVLPQTRIVVQANTAQGIALPWELLADPSLACACLAYEAAAFVRGEADLTREPLALHGETLNILLAISRPAGEDDVPFQSVARHLMAAFQQEQERIAVEVLRPATFEELGRRLQAQPGHYHVFHFDGHGVYRAEGAPGTLLYGEAGGKLAFEDRLVSGEDLGRALAAGQVPLVLLNACQSGMVRAEDNVVSLGNELLRAGACGVVAMSYSVYVQTAARFMRDLYERLRAGDDLAGAHKKSVAALRNTPVRKSALGTEERLLDWIVPVLFESVEVTPLPKRSGFHPSQPSERPKILEVGVPPPPFYGFFGRDGVLFRLERQFHNSTVALLWGMAGVGKTTTATEFVRWWGNTGALKGPIFFTSFERPKTLEQVILEIGQALQPTLKSVEVEWEHLTGDEKRQTIVDFLVQIPCFLVWDNFEPVSGFPSGSSSLLDHTKQAELKAFLVELHTKKAASKVLITSRRAAEPLLTLFASIPLGGLPRHEALELAGAILAQQGMDSVALRALPEFNDLLKFLNGNPLALQVILPLLKDGTKPKVLLQKLQEGTVELPEKDITEQGQEKSLTASLSYRLDSLSPEDAQRLNVVGLFQGFVDADILALISKDSTLPPLLQGISASEWTRILTIAAEIGLLREEGTGLFTIHPALPWFFHERLVSTFGSAVQDLERVYAEAYGQYGEWLFTTFKSKPETVVNLLKFEEANLLYALSLSQKNKQDGATSGALYGLNRLWKLQGRWEEFDCLLVGVESTIQNKSGEPLEGKEFLWRICLGMRQEIAHYQRDFDSVNEMLLKLKKSYENQEDEKNVAVALHQLGRIAEERRDFAEAEKWYRESLAIAQRIGDDYGVASTLHQLGIIAQERRDFTEAEKWYRDSLAIAQRIGDDYGVAQTLHQLGRIAEERRDFTEAEKWYRDSLAIKQRIGDDHGVAQTLHQLGNIAEERRDFTEAEKWYRDSLAIEQRIGDDHGVAITLHQLGRIAQERRDFAEAEKWYRDSLAIKQRIGDDHGVAQTLHQLGRIAEERRDFTEAEKWYRQSKTMFENLQDPHALDIVKRSLARLVDVQQKGEGKQKWSFKSFWNRFRRK